MKKKLTGYSENYNWFKGGTLHEFRPKQKQFRILLSVFFASKNGAYPLLSPGHFKNLFPILLTGK